MQCGFYARHCRLEIYFKDTSAEGLDTSVLVEPHTEENDHQESSNFSHFAKITACGARSYEASFSADSIFEARPRSAILEK